MAATYQTEAGATVTTRPHLLPWGNCWTCSGCGRSKFVPRRDLDRLAEQHAATCRRIPRT